MVNQETRVDNVECPFQQIGLGTLVCAAADTSIQNSTNEVSAIDCANCEAGKIYREVGCDSFSPKIRKLLFVGGSRLEVISILCKITKTQTSLEDCKKCTLTQAPTTKEIVSTARGLFQDEDFYSAFAELEKARKNLRDGQFPTVLTNSLACLESTMKTILEKLKTPVQNPRDNKELWKKIRERLGLDQIERVEDLLNTLYGLITKIEGVRDSLSDAHGKGSISVPVSEVIAELMINTCSTLSTTLVRRYKQIKIEKGGEGD